MSWDRCDRCPGCKRPVEELVYGKSGLCADCYGELREDARAAKALQHRARGTIPHALGHLLHAQGLTGVADALGVAVEVVRVWLRTSVVPSPYGERVQSAWSQVERGRR